MRRGRWGSTTGPWSGSSSASSSSCYSTPPPLPSSGHELPLVSSVVHVVSCVPSSFFLQFVVIIFNLPFVPAPPWPAASFFPCSVLVPLAHLFSSFFDHAGILSDVLVQRSFGITVAWIVPT